MRSGVSGAGCLDASFAVSAMRARECRWHSALSIIAPSVNELRRTRRKPSTIRGAAPDVVIGQSTADRSGARPYQAEPRFGSLVLTSSLLDFLNALVKSLTLLAFVLTFLLPMIAVARHSKKERHKSSAGQGSQIQPTPQVQPSPQAPQTVPVEHTAKDSVDQGLAKYGAGNYEGAISDFNEAIQLDPKY